MADSERALGQPHIERVTGAAVQWLRDGLQIEKPITLEAKIALLEAIVATGVREVEATAFVSPSKVPALADAVRELGGPDDVDEQRGDLTQLPGEIHAAAECACHYVGAHVPAEKLTQPGSFTQTGGHLVDVHLE